MEELKNKVLVVGESSSTILKGIIGKEASPVKLPSTTIEYFSWPLSTKYYQNNINFIQLDSYSIENIPLEISENVEALILTFDLTKRETFELIKKWTKYIEERNPSLLLCVGNIIDENKSKEVLVQHHQQYLEWSVENGLEYISMLNWEEEIEDEVFKEKRGIERIIECLQTNMWSTMEFKPNPKMTFLNEEPILLDDEKENVIEEQNEVPEKKELLNRGKPILTQNGNPFLNELIEPSMENEEDIDAKFNLKDFEKTITSISSVREKSKNLPDNERRALAAQFAMSFLSQFGDSSSDEEK